MKKREKDKKQGENRDYPQKCEGCVWGTKICGEKILCKFFSCVKEKGKSNGAAGNKN